MLEKYYKVNIVQGNIKKKQFYRTLYIRSKTGINNVFDVVRKVSFAKMLDAKEINREQYIAGVSSND